MSIGDKRNITINPNNGYGPYKDDLVFEYDKDKMPKNTELKIGKRIDTKNKGTKAIVKMTILKIGNDYVILDANHPLAGKTLNFDIELIELESNLN